MTIRPLLLTLLVGTAPAVSAEPMSTGYVWLEELRADFPTSIPYDLSLCMLYSYEQAEVVDLNYFGDVARILTNDRSKDWWFIRHNNSWQYVGGEALSELLFACGVGA